ncbi:MAG: class I SAM-dependent methyltransferase [Hyphomonadaceae bacterium]|nr:class I SAM-dependent methyltransferase [Hyphomonadaceae bacterium]
MSLSPQRASFPDSQEPQEAAMLCAVSKKPCDFVSRGSFLDRSGMVGNIEVRQCRHCNHAVTQPPIADVSFLYGDRESQDYQPDTKGGISRAIKNIAFRAQARKLLRQIGTPGRRALDFGCGSGQFTRVLGEMLPGTELVGSDFFHSPPAELAGKGYTHSDALASQADSFDLVMAFHVLEHDDDVAGLLDRILTPARRGATVVVEVPNVECAWNKVFGRFWDAWYVPFHRNHFSRRSLVSILEGRGLNVRAVHSITAPTMGRTMANLAGQTNNLFWLLLGIALHPLQLLGEKMTGQPTAIRVIATKQ